MNDATLVAQAQECGMADEDRTWVADMFEAHHQRLAAYAAGLLGGDRAAAVDCVQETFLRLCRQRRAGVESYVQAWLFRTCRNLAIDHLRRSKRMTQTESIEWIGDTRGATDPGSRVAEADELQRCSQAIACLPPQQQEVLQLRLNHGLSYKQISDVTGLTVNHVGVTLHQAVQRLRAVLAT